MDYAHIKSRFRLSHIEKLYKDLLAEKDEKWSKHPEKRFYTMPYGLTIQDYLNHFSISVELKDDRTIIHVSRLYPLSDRNQESKYRVLSERIVWLPSTNKITAPGFGLHDATPDMLDRMIRSNLSDGLKNWCYTDICF